jgi:Protein of unknown function (DUF1570)
MQKWFKHVRCARVICCALVALPFLVNAVDFGPVKNYPNIGLAFPNLRQPQADPVPPPETYAYIRIETDNITRVDQFKPYDLWYRKISCGRWFDNSGCRLILGRLSHEVPVATEEKVTREDFEQLFDSAKLTSAEAQKVLKELVEAFSGYKVEAPQKLPQSGRALSTIYSFPCEKTNTLIYTFRPSKIEGDNDPDWFCVIIETPPVRDISKVKAQVEASFLGKIETPTRSSEEKGVESSELTVTKKEPAIDLPDHPVRIEACKSIENYDSWWIYETEGFVILSDVSSEMGKPVVTELLKTLPLLKKAFTALVPPLTHDEDVAIIRIFQRPEDYVNYVGKDKAWSGGLWMPARRELVLREVPSTPAISKTLRHEAFHQYLSTAYCLLVTPPWMNEGHAMFFENATLNAKGKLVFEEDERSVGLLLQNLDAVLPVLPDFMKTSYTDFYAGTDAQREMKYALAWGLVYYLQKGVPTESNATAKNLLQTLGVELADTQDYAQAMERVLASLDMKSFQSSFKEFWVRRRSAAKQYDPLK